MSEERIVAFEEILERIDDAFFALDDDWRFTFLNERAAALLDVDREAVLGENVWDEFPAAVDTTFQTEYERAMETNDPVAFEEYYPPLDRWFEVNAYPGEDGLSVYFRDVTDRVEREQRLERYEALVETAQDGIYTVDGDGQFTMVNDAYLEMTGYDRSELLGSHVSQVVDSSVVEEAAAIEERLESGERDTATIVATIERKDGTTFEAEATFSMTDHGERVGIVRDISDRRERERELSRTRELLEGAERIADVGGWEIDPETEEVFWTDHLFDILEAEFDEEPPLDGALDVYHDADRQFVEESVNEAIESGEGFDIEARFETPSGAVRWLRIQGVPKVEDGDVTMLRGTVQDVTERKSREEQLDLYRRIVETVDDGVYAVDDRGEFVLVNDAFCRMTGREREELVGESVSRVHEDGLPSDVQRRIDEVVNGERRRATVQFEFQPHEAESFPAEVRFETFPLEDGVGRCGVVRDISDRRERERELRKRVEQQAIVTRLGERALEEGSVDELMDEAARLVAEALDAEYSKVLELDADGEALLLRRGVGWRDGLVGSETVSAVDDDSQAAYTLATSDPVVVEDLETETRFSGPELLTSHGVRSGISTVVGSEDDPWGIFAVHGTDDRSFSTQDVSFVQSVANVLGSAIRRHRNERELRTRHERLTALNDINSLAHGLAESLFGLSSTREIEQLVCDRLAASDSYEFAWIGAEADGEVVVSTEAGVEGYLSDITLSLDAPSSEWGPTVEAHRTAEMQVVQSVRDDPRYEPWRDRGAAYGYRASASVPVVDGGEQYGTLNVYSARADAFGEEERAALERLGSIVAYAIRAVERDRQLQRERDRIEFMNRLLRHNLLNSLNVVDARLDLLDGRVDYEVSDHLETAAERTSEMIGFVESVREVTKVIGDGEEQELAPVDIGETLAARVERARKAYPEADFHLEETPSTDVVADDLLGEVLDNVLVNAVQHNDGRSPTVWVETTVTPDEVVVAVADDGPGIPPDRRDRVFDRETKDFENPGSGFGLYLVAEILDSYDGAIDVSESDAGGARFELTFQRA